MFGFSLLQLSLIITYMFTQDGDPSYEEKTIFHISSYFFISMILGLIIYKVKQRFDEEEESKVRKRILDHRGDQVSHEKQPMSGALDNILRVITERSTNTRETTILEREQ